MKSSQSSWRRSRHAVMAACLAGLMPLSAAVAAESVIVVVHDVDMSFPAEATVEAVREVKVSAQVQGRVTELRVEAGQRVRKGELLLRIDSREEAGSNAAAQANLIQARAAWERSKDLHARKFVSKAALDQAEAGFKAAQGAADAAGATLSHTTVTAPLAGVIAERFVELGEMASPGVPLVSVFDPHGLRVVASIPQHKLAELKQDGKARVEFPGSGRWIDVRRIEILPTIDAKSHTATARLYLPDGIEGVVPGMAVRAHFSVGQAKKLSLPPAAVMQRGEITAVYVLDEKGVPRLRQVRLGEALAGGELEVLAGLSSGERVSLEPVKAGIALKAR